MPGDDRDALPDCGVQGGGKGCPLLAQGYEFFHFAATTSH